MTGIEKGDLLIQVTAWACLTVFYSLACNLSLPTIVRCHVKYGGMFI